MDFDAEQEDRLSCEFNTFHGFVDRLGQRASVAADFRLLVGRRRVWPDVDHIARDFDVDRALVASTGRERAIDLAERRERIGELGAGDA
jgi:hypothetical protein